METDSELEKWLQDEGLHNEGAKLLKEGFSLEQLLYHTDGEELNKIGLRKGDTLKIMRAIVRHRNANNAVNNVDVSDVSSTE